MRLCAICVSNVANTIEEDEGRKFFACSSCVGEEVQPPPAEPPMSGRVLSMLIVSPGLRSFEVAAALGMSGAVEENHVSATLSRLVRQGLARFEGPRSERFYFPTYEPAPVKRAPVLPNNGRDLLGERFGALVVIAQAESRDGHRFWHCECACGTRKAIRASSLINGNIKSCGCRSSRRTPPKRRKASAKEQISCAS